MKLLHTNINSSISDLQKQHGSVSPVVAV